jgi:putative membrane protein
MKYHSKAHKFFTQGERERIKAATEEAESRTIGEVAAMVVDSSDHYMDAEVVGGAVLAGLAALVPTVVYFHASVWSFIPLGFLLFFPARILFARVPFLKAALIGRRRKEHAVRLRAMRAFYEKDLHRTGKNTGVLFFLSLFERKVWVLADSGIHAKIEQKTLDRFAGMVSTGIREGRACDALCDAIREAGDLLAKYFPSTPDDTNELPDDVMTG